MKQDLTDIVMLLDRSGSMMSVKDDTIGGVNAFLKTQREAPGSAVVTVAQFDTEYETVYAGRPVKEAPDLTPATFVPRGGTALLDAICRLIDETGERLKAMPEPERPGVVVFVIVTDGQENSSLRDSKGLPLHSIQFVNEKIRLQRDVYKWQFVFLGANQDAIATASAMGMSSALAANYQNSPLGTQKAYGNLGMKVNATRGAVASGQSIGSAVGNLAWTDAERADMEDDKK